MSPSLGIFNALCWPVNRHQLLSRMRHRRNSPLSKQHRRLSGQDLLSVAQQPVAAGRRGQMPQRREPKGIHKQRPDAVIHKHLRQQQDRRSLDKRRPRPRILVQIRPSRAAEESRGQHQLERHGFRGSVALCLCVCVFACWDASRSLEVGATAP